MIISVAIQAYLTHIAELLKGQGFDPDMNIIYDAEQAQTDEWLSDELAVKHMARKGTTTKDDVRRGPLMALFWTRSSLEPIIRRPYRLLDRPDDSASGIWGKSTVNGSFRIACSFVSNKGNSVEDLEEAFLARFQGTYNVPLSLEYIYNSARDNPLQAKTNFTVIQNKGEADLINYKEGNLFAYTWSADIYMNYISEFAWSQVFPAEKVVVDLYDPNGIPLSSLDADGNVHTHMHVATDGTTVPDVPDEPSMAFISGDPRDYAQFSITLPYSVPYYDGKPDTPEGTDPAYMPSAYGISDESRALISAAVHDIGGEISIRSTKYMVVARMPLSLNHKENATYDEDIMAAAGAIQAAVKAATSGDYIVTPLPAEE